MIEMREIAQINTDNQKLSITDTFSPGLLNDRLVWVRNPGTCTRVSLKV